MPSWAPRGLGRGRRSCRTGSWSACVCASAPPRLRPSHIIGAQLAHRIGLVRLEHSRPQHVRARRRCRAVRGRRPSRARCCADTTESRPRPREATPHLPRGRHGRYKYVGLPTLVGWVQQPKSPLDNSRRSDDQIELRNHVGGAARKSRGSRRGTCRGPETRFMDAGKDR